MCHCIYPVLAGFMTDELMELLSKRIKSSWHDSKAESSVNSKTLYSITITGGGAILDEMILEALHVLSVP